MGKIIVIEGTDGTGKKTQTELLLNALQNLGYNAKKHSFPTYDSPSSALVKMYLGGEIVKTANELDAYQASVLYSVDRLCTMKSFTDFLQDDGVLVLDRYVQSNMIHQGGKIKNKKERQIFLDWIYDFEFNKLALPKPDLVFFLDLPIALSQKLMNERKILKNGKDKDIHENDKSHLTNSFKTGKLISSSQGWTEIKCYEDEQILSPSQIHNKIMGQVMKIIKNK